MERFGFKIAHFVLVALAALCLTGCPDQDTHSSTSHSGSQKPTYETPAGDGLMLLALGGAVVAAGALLRRKK